MAVTNDAITIARPHVVQVALTVCDETGTQASIVFNLVIFQDSSLREFLPILREAQDQLHRRLKVMEDAAHAHAEGSVRSLPKRCSNAHAKEHRKACWVAGEVRKGKRRAAAEAAPIKRNLELVAAGGVSPGGRTSWPRKKLKAADKPTARWVIELPAPKDPRVRGQVQVGWLAMRPWSA